MNYYISAGGFSRSYRDLFSRISDTFFGVGVGGGPSRSDSIQELFGTVGRTHSVSATAEVLI